MSQKSIRHPERHMGSRCGAMVEKGHIGYPCSRPLGHTAIPAGDPEPCYAVEVPSSLGRWQAWDERQQFPLLSIPPSDDEFSVKIASGHCENIYEHSAHILNAVDGTGLYCDGTGIDPSQVVVDPQNYPDWLEVYGQPGPTVAQMPILIEVYESASANSPKVSAEMKPMRIQWWEADRYRVVPSKAWTDAQIASQARLRQFVDCGPVCEEAGTHHTSDPNCVMHESATQEPHDVQASDEPVEPFVEPTKQRDGDQQLPVGGVDCVQDIIIEAMQESKRIGIKRYGSPLMTFNGRKGIQDIAEEARDFFVYTSQMVAEADADRGLLIEVVTAALTSYPGQSQVEGDPENVAEQAVNAIIGWVIGNKPTLNVPPMDHSAEDQMLFAVLTELSDTYGIMKVLSVAYTIFQRGEG